MEKQNLVALFQTMSVGIVYQDAHGAIISANQAAEDLLGLTTDQLMGKTSMDPEWHAIHPDGSLFPGETHPAMVALQTAKPLHNIPMGVYHQSKKQYVWILINAYPEFTKNSDRPFQVFTTFTDVSHLIETEKRLVKESNYQQLLSEISRAFINTTQEETDIRIKALLQKSCQFAESERAYIFFYDQVFKHNTKKYEWLTEGVHAQQDNLHTHESEQITEWFEKHQHGKTVFIDTSSEPEVNNSILELLAQQQVQSLMAVPLMDGTICMGFIGIDTITHPHHFTHEEETLFRVFADTLVSVYKRLHAEKQIRSSSYMLNERAKELRCIHEMTELSVDTDIQLDDYFAKILSIIPQGYQFPENVSIRINFQGKEYSTPKYTPSSTCMKAALIIQEANYGSISIMNPEGIQFLHEEYNLLNNIKRNIELFIEKKDTISKLETEKEKYAIIANNTYNWEFWKDEFGNYVFMSPACEKITGYPAAAFGSGEKHVSDLVHPDDLLKYQKYQKDALEKKTTQTFSFRIYDKTGTLKTIEQRCTAIYNDTGNLLGLRGTNTDITEKEYQSKLLTESEKKYRFLFDGAPDPYLILHDGKFIECNDSATRILKMSKEKFIGKSPMDISPVMQPNGVDSATYAAELIDKAFTKGEQEFEWTHLTADGTPIIVQVKLIKTEYNNIPVLFTTWRDITELKQAQETIKSSAERFNEVTKHSKSVIWEVDLTGKYIYVSDAAESVFGYPTEELIGKYFYDLHPENDKKSYAKKGLSLITNGTEIIDFHNPIIKKDGTIIWVSTNGTPIRDNKNTVIGYKGVDTDITARKLAEDEVRKFRTISDQANYGSAISDLNGTLLYCNERFATKHGYQVEELIGKSLLSLHNESQLPRVHQLLELIKQEGGFNAEEVNHCKKDGSVFPSLMSAKMILNEQGEPQYFSATVIDISSIKEVEKNLKEKSIELNNAQLIANMGSWELDLMTNETKWSENYYRILEVSRDTRPEASIFYGLIYPEDKVLIKQKEEELIRTKQPVSFEMRLLMSNNRIKWIQNNVVGIFKEDKLVGLKGVNIDITEKKLQQDQIRIQNERLSAIIEAMPDLIFISDREGNYLEFIKSGHKIEHHGYSNVVGKNLVELYSPELAKIHLANIQRCLDTGERISYEYEWYDNHEKIFYEGTIVRLDQNKVLRFVRDISDRKRIEQELKVVNTNLEKRIHERTRELERSNVELLYARVEAEEANKSKNEFLSRMSHELRTPMNSILGFAQLLEMGELNESQKKSVLHILRSGKHLLDLINEVLDIAKIESGKISLSIESVSLYEIVEDCIETVQLLADDHQVSIHHTIDTDANLFVKADNQRIKQIVLNIINNAIKYNVAEGHIWISYKTIPTIKGNCIRLLIKDSGLGIDEKDLTKVFMPFERVPMENLSIEGSGLGLAVTKQLTELMGGAVGVESKLGMGSTFWVEFPQSNSPVNPSNLIIDLQQIESLTSSMNGVILYIEDNSSNVELVEQIIQSKRANIQLEVTMFGKKALPIAKEIHPSLILLDLNLPDMHGSDVLIELKNDVATANIPVVVISADAMPAQISKLKALGASAYLTKPIEIKELLNVIDSHFSKQSIYER